jgi:predicted nucleic acid-binding protein
MSVLVADTSGLLAALDFDEAEHAGARQAVDDAAVVVLSPFVLAELDYLVMRRVGVRAQLALLAQVADRAYDLATFTADDVAAMHALCRRFEDQEIGVTDASVALLADRHATDAVLTLDERHFRMLRRSDGRQFRLLPADGA